MELISYPVPLKECFSHIILKFKFINIWFVFASLSNFFNFVFDNDK